MDQLKFWFIIISCMVHHTVLFPIKVQIYWLHQEFSTSHWVVQEFTTAKNMNWKRKGKKHVHIWETNEFMVHFFWDQVCFSSSLHHESGKGGYCLATTSTINAGICIISCLWAQYVQQMHKIVLKDMNGLAHFITHWPVNVWDMDSFLSELPGSELLQIYFTKCLPEC